MLKRCAVGLGVTLLFLACSSSSSSTTPGGDAGGGGDTGGNNGGTPACAPKCGDGQSCISAANCASGSCIMGTCVGGKCTKDCTYGEPCTSNTQCASGVCTNGLCGCTKDCADGEACTSNGQCSSGVCTSGACAAPACSPSCALGAACGANADCSSNNCVSGKCATPPACSSKCAAGSACTTGAGCASGVCTNGTCSATGCAPMCATGDGCSSGGDCSSGECLSGTCVGTTGDACTSDGQCASSVCTSGLCAAPMCSPECQFGQMCGSMEDCTAGLVCNDGVCTTPEDMDGGVGTHDSGSGGGGDGGGGMRGFVGTIIATAGISDYQVTATFAAKANAPATSCDGGPVYGSCCWQAAGATAPAPTYPPIDIGTLKVTDGSSTLATISAGSDDTYSVDSSSDSSLSWGSGDTLAFAGSGSSVYTSFSGSVTTPSAPSVNTIQPDEDGGTVSITMPIPVSWGAGSNKQEIVVNMAIYPAEGGMTSTGSIICSAKDSDGSLTIPASALEANAAKGDKATVLVSRVVASDTIVEGGVVSFQAVAQSQQQITLGP